MSGTKDAGKIGEYYQDGKSIEELIETVESRSNKCTSRSTAHLIEMTLVSNILVSYV
ncbi:MAG: hypothetical protein Crog3KO_12790 [Crocinitomicaceae bacterium]